MTDTVELYRRAIDEFGGRVALVKDDQWHNDTPCTDWDVRVLVNHLVNEDRWVPPLLDGQTIDQVGDRFDGDLLGDDPKQAWKEASEEALAAAGRPGAMEATAHLSFGDFPGRDYVMQVLVDHVIHAWDLARGIDADDASTPISCRWRTTSSSPRSRRGARAARSASSSRSPSRPTSRRVSSR